MPSPAPETTHTWTLDRPESWWRRPRLENEGEAAPYRSLDEHEAPAAPSPSRPPLDTATSDDVESSFFYRASDDNDALRPPRRLRSNVVDALDGEHRYSQARDVAMPPNVLQNYRQRYAQLNQPHTHYHEYDLQLLDDDSSDVALISQPSHQSTAHSSSLLEQQHDGRVVLKRLPRDHVRLLMDPDLEPGILSVEQTRRAVDDEYASQQRRPPLQYVLTISDDMYQRLVSEMSETLTQPFCGMCLEENHKSDIRIALYILGSVLALLLILTTLWPHS